MVTTETGIADKLHQFIKGYADDKYCLELLRFWAKHSCMQFNRLAIITGFNGNRLHAERALKRLVGDGVVKTYVENNDPRYSLAKDESLRSLISELARFDWHQWRSITGKLCVNCAS